MIQFPIVLFGVLGALALTGVVALAAVGVLMILELAVTLAALACINLFGRKDDL